MKPAANAAAAAVARSLCFSILAYAITSLFISVAYQSLLPILTGLVIALECAVAKSLRRSPTPFPRRGALVPAVAAPVPAVGVPFKGYSAPTGSNGLR
jgi:hypothetical protein